MRVLSLAIEMRCSSVCHFCYDDLFSFISGKACSQMHELPNKLEQQLLVAAHSGVLTTFSMVLAY
jgi:uncharacterized protein YuzB (UPF0349 family)